MAFLPVARLFFFSLQEKKRAIMKNEILALERAVNTLPPQCMMVFKLVREDGLSYQEAARLLSISPKAVEKQMNIAIEKLTQALRNSLLIQNISL